MNEKPKAPFDNPDTREFWDAVRSGRVMVQHCTDCGENFAYPRPFCVHCFSDNVSLIESSGHGQIYAKTVVHLPAQEGGETGYSVTLVDLPEGVRLLARLDGGEAQTGQAVTLRWDFSGDRPLLVASVPDVVPGR